MTAAPHDRSRTHPASRRPPPGEKQAPLPHPASGRDPAWAQAAKVRLPRDPQLPPPVLPGGKAVTHLRLERTQFLNLCRSYTLRNPTARRDGCRGPSSPWLLPDQRVLHSWLSAGLKHHAAQVPPPRGSAANPQAELVPRRRGLPSRSLASPHPPEGASWAQGTKQAGKYRCLT